METVYKYVPEFMLNNSVIWGLLLYWLPLVLCSVFYSTRFIKFYRADLSARDGVDNSEYYKPSLTVGAILNAVIVIGLPLVNLVYATLHAGPHLFSGLFKWLGRVFDCPLVPDSANYREQRIQKAQIERSRKREAELRNLKGADRPNCR